MSAALDHFKKRLRDGKRIVLDGGFGTELQRRGIKTTLPLWSAAALMKNPNDVKQIHRDYIDAGAEIATTNTFRTNSRTFAHAKIPNQAREYTMRAVELAALARDESGKTLTLIAGSISPVEDCYTPGLVPTEMKTLIDEHTDMAINLRDGGADVIWIETMNTIKETLAALEAAQNANMETVVSFVCTPEGDLFSGEKIEDAIAAIEKYNPLAILTNCSSAKNIGVSMSRIMAATNIPSGAYANGDGEPHPDQGWIFHDEHFPESYAGYAREWLKSGALIVGGCCGTTPDYIQGIRTIVDEFNA
jgi:homocysteine S-methyltransferase